MVEPGPSNTVIDIFRPCDEPAKLMSRRGLHVSADRLQQSLYGMTVTVGRVLLSSALVIHTVYFRQVLSLARNDMGWIRWRNHHRKVVRFNLGLPICATLANCLATSWHRSGY